MQGFLRRTQQQILQKEVPAGIPCKAKFREHKYFGSLRLCRLDGANDLFAVEFAIRKSDLRRCRRNLYKTVFHDPTLLFEITYRVYDTMLQRF